MEEKVAILSSEENNSFFDVEIEALKSIYVNEIEVLKNDSTTTVSIDLHPATADNVHEQYVKMTLKLRIPSEYPQVLPEIVIRNPRGLSDEKLASISDDLLKLAESKKGNSMLFEMIEAAKDHLTAENRPCEECAICLCGFHEKDVFTKTECYHYFHSHCLAQYSKTFKKNEFDSDSNKDASANELLCPVCRLPIHFEESETSFPPPIKSGEEFVMTDAVLESQKKMHELYNKQVEKGGIIDIEAEKNKYLLEISQVPSIADVTPEATVDDESIEENSEEKDVDSTSSLSNIPSSNSKQASTEELLNHKSRNKNSMVDTNEDARKSNRRNGFDRNNHYERNKKNYNEKYEGKRHENYYQNERFESGRKNYRYQKFDRNSYEKNERSDKYNANARYDRRNDGEQRNTRFNSDRNYHYNGDRRNYYDRDRRNFQNGGDRRTNHYDSDRKNNRYDSGRRYDRYDDFERKNDQYCEERKNTRFDREQRGRPPNNRPHEERQYEDKEEDNYENIPSDDLQSEACNDGYKTRRYDPERRNDRYGDERKNTRFDREQRGRLLNDKPHEERRYEDKEDNCENSPSDDLQSEACNDGYKTRRYDSERRNDRYGEERKNTRFDREQRGRPPNDRSHEERRYEDKEDNCENSLSDNLQSETCYAVDGYKTRSFNDNKKNDRYRDNRRNGQYNSDRRNTRYNYGKRNENFNGDRRNFKHSEHYNHANKYTKFNRAQRNESYKRNNRENGEFKNIKENEVNSECLKNEVKENEQLSKSPDLTSHDSENLFDKVGDTNLHKASSSDADDSVICDSRTDSISKDKRSSNALSYSSGYKSNFPERTNDYGKSNEKNKRNINRYNSNYSPASRASLKSSNYDTQKRHSKSESLEKESLNSNATNQSASKQWADQCAQEDDNDESECYKTDDIQNLKRSNRPYKEKERSNYSKSFREDKFQNRNYRESQPYRNNGRFRNNQSGFSNYSNKRYNLENHDSSQNSSIEKTETLVNSLNEANSEEVVSTVAENLPSKSSDLIHSKTSNVENSVPTSNFLPPMSSVAPPPGFQNPTRKIVYGLAAANPPPGFHRS